MALPVFGSAAEQSSHGQVCPPLMAPALVTSLLLQMFRVPAGAVQSCLCWPRPWDRDTPAAPLCLKHPQCFFFLLFKSSISITLRRETSFLRWRLKAAFLGSVNVSCSHFFYLSSAAASILLTLFLTCCSCERTNPGNNSSARKAFYRIKELP